METLRLLLTALFEISVLWGVFYLLYRVFNESRLSGIFIGLVAGIIVLGIILNKTQAEVLKYLISSSVAIVTILTVIFQAEIRAFLTKIRSRSSAIKQILKDEKADYVETIRDSVAYLASHRFGALIVICRDDKLEKYTDSGVEVDAILTRELLGTIFRPKSLLHDGAVIINNDRIVSAASILPVSEKEFKDRSTGLRHRAGIGLAEMTDAVVIIVSEETGSVSIAVGNLVERAVATTDYMIERLNELLYAKQAKK